VIPSEETFWTGRRSAILLAALSAFLYFFRLGALDIASTDEARRSLVIRAMIRTGNYVIPTLEGATYLKKPPLFYWLGALSSRLTGSSDAWAYRLPSALAALVTVLAFYALAERLLSRRTALLAAAMLATCYMFMDRASRAQIDMTLACFVMLAMVCLERARASGWQGAAPWGFWITCGLAVLTKGPVGLLFPLGAALALAAGPGFLSETRRMRPFLGLAVMAAVLLPWGAAVIHRIGPDGAWALLYRESFSGYAEEARSHAEPLLFYLYQTPAEFLPWSAFLPAAVLALRAPKTAEERRALRFVWSWLLPALVVLSLTHQKRSYYLLPAFGAIALWHAWALDRFLLRAPSTGEDPRPRWLARAALYVFGAGAVAAALGGGAYLRLRQPEIWSVAAAAVVPLGLWGMYAVVSLRRGRPGRSLVAVVLLSLLYVTTQRGLLAPWTNAHKSPRPFAQAVARELPAGTTLLMFLHDQPYFEFYVGHPVEREDSEEGLRRRLASGRPVYVVLEEKDYLPRRELFRRRVIRYENYVHRGKTMVLASN
jgi:4-amino-4-deoxy-L-arabinose transferase-like glycosyltransferase